MEKQLSSFRLVFLVLFLLLFTSCLELKVTINFRSETAGTVTLEALQYRMAKGINWENLALPTTREGWSQVVVQVPGASVTSFELIPDDLGTRTKTVVTFASIRALESLFVIYKQKLTLLQDAQGKYNLVLQPLVPKLSAAAVETRKLWIDLWGDSTWKFVVQPPGNPTGTVFTVTLRDLAAEKAPREWKASW